MDFSHLANVPIIDGHIHHGLALRRSTGEGRPQVGARSAGWGWKAAVETVSLA